VIACACVLPIWGWGGVLDRYGPKRGGYPGGGRFIKRIIPKSCHTYPAFCFCNILQFIALRLQVHAKLTLTSAAGGTRTQDIGRSRE